MLSVSSENNFLVADLVCGAVVNYVELLVRVEGEKTEDLL